MRPNPHPDASSAPTPDGTRQTVRPPAGWVAVRSLGPHHRGHIARHLKALSADDRYLRFGYPATDEHIERYAQQLDFRRDELFGVYDERLQLVALAHLAFGDEAAPGIWPMAEFGGSVLASHRQLRLGARLFDHAILRARNRGVDMLLIHALSENARMLRIVRQAGGLVQRRGPEADALVVLPPVTLASRLEAWLVEQVARMDYRLKRRARSVAAAAA